MDLDDMELKATREANGANRRKENIEILQNFINEDWNCKYTLTKVKQSMKNILAELEKKDKVIDEIKEYANWHIDCYTEDIADYIDDDRIGNANIIGEFKEQREHWKDILRILNNEKTYIDYKNY